LDNKELILEYFKYLGSLITNYVRCTGEMKSRIVLARRLSTGRRPLLPADWN